MSPSCAARRGTSGRLSARRRRRRRSPLLLRGSQAAGAPAAAAAACAPGDVVDEQGAGRAPVVGPGDGPERLLAGLRQRQRRRRRWGGRAERPGPGARPPALRRAGELTVSQICSLICLPSMGIMRAPNSTPMVRSCTGWKRLSVNCSSRHDLPTPAARRVGSGRRGGGGGGSGPGGGGGGRGQRWGGELGPGMGAPLWPMFLYF